MDGAPSRPDELALFRCLLAKDIDGAAQLLAEAPAGSLALEGPQGFTALHAALGACGPAVPLLPALVAAGTPLDVCLEATETDDGQQGNGNLPGSVLAFMRACGMQCVYYEQFGRLQVGMTPLGFAAAQAAQDRGACALALLELGADVNVGLPSPLAALLEHHNITHGDANQALAAALLRRSADCLAPAGRSNRVGMVAATPPRRLPNQLFAHVEQQLQQGQLHISGFMAAAGLLELAAQRQHPGLLQHGLDWLHAHAATSAEAVPTLDEEDLWALADIVGSLAADNWVVEAAVTALLSWQPPITLHRADEMLGQAALQAHRSPAVLRRLRALGAPLELHDVVEACHRLDVHRLAALLACDAPPVDVTKPVLASHWRFEVVWSNPLHQVLARLSQGNEADAAHLEGRALQCVELLIAAGYRPTVYANVRTGDVRGMLRHLEQQGLPEMLAELDVFDPALQLHPAWVQQTRAYWLAHALLHPPTWSKEEHHKWPVSFQRATRALLLAASRSKGEGIAALPAEIMMLVIRQAATLLANWVTADVAAADPAAAAAVPGGAALAAFGI